VGHYLSSMFTAEMVDDRVCDQQPRLGAYERAERMYHFLGDQEPEQHERDVFRKGKTDLDEDEQEEESILRTMLSDLIKYFLCCKTIVYKLYAVDKI